MAIVSNDRYGQKTVVGWVEDGRKRSKKLDTEVQAVIFKSLVEQNGEQYPSHTTLHRHGLIEFGFTINPEYILGVRAMALREDVPAEERIRMIADALRDF